MTAGHFPSIEDAIRVAVADMKAATTADLSWVKPYLEEARSAAARGETVALAEHRVRMAQRLGVLKR